MSQKDKTASSIAPIVNRKRIRDLTAENSRRQAFRALQVRLGHDEHAVAHVEELVQNLDARLQELGRDIVGCGKHPGSLALPTCLGDLLDLEAVALVAAFVEGLDRPNWYAIDRA